MYFSRLPILLLVLLEFGCRKEAAGPPPRYAIVRFENLSGDPSLDWTGRAASEVLPAMLEGAMNGPVLNPATLSRLAPNLGTHPPSAPGTSTERTEALMAGASRLISGYLERDGSGIRITASEEDLATGKTLRSVSSTAASPFDAIGGLAHELAAAAKPYATSNGDAVRLYATSLELPLPAGKENLDRAVQIAPDFGPAWLALTRLETLEHDRGAAEDVIARARRQKLDALTEANLDYEAAAVAGDPSARLAALKKISVLSPGDGLLLRSLAETELTAGEFTGAASDWKKLTDLAPGDGAAWNSLGYARSYAGDFTGAMAALQEYKRLRPGDANPPDSIGDLNYAYRRFGDAAASYLEAYGKDASFQQGGDLYKAAWGKFRAGDKTGADALFAKFRAAREKANEAAFPLIAGDWLYRTGRAGDASAELRRAADGAQSVGLRAEAWAQLAIWDLLAKDRARAAADANNAGYIVNVSVAIAHFAAMPSASAEEWQARADRTFRAPAMAPLRRLALGYALLLDGHRDAALPVWAEIAKTSAATDFATQAIYTRLQGKPLQRALLPDPNSVNAFAAVIDNL